MNHDKPSLQARIAELIRFGSVGVACAGIYFVLLAALTRFFDLPMALRAACSYVPCMLANYLLHRSFTFQSDKRHSHGGPRYVVVQLGGMLINSGVLWLGVDRAAWPYVPVQLVALGMMASWSYLGQKLWTFS